MPELRRPEVTQERGKAGSWTGALVGLLVLVGVVTAALLVLAGLFLLALWLLKFRGA